MSVRAGQMRHRVRIESRAATQSASGEPTLTWSLYAERWASVEPLVGREVYASQTRVGRLPTVFRMRYVTGVQPRMRLVWGSKVFDVKSVQTPRGIPHETILLAEELVEEAA